MRNLAESAMAKKRGQSREGRAERAEQRGYGLSTEAEERIAYSQPLPSFLFSFWKSSTCG
jgi:hypothetical protein